MTDEQIVGAAKFAEKKTEFGELVHSKVSRGVNSAYGIGFLEGAEWAREQMMKEAVCYIAQPDIVATGNIVIPFIRIGYTALSRYGIKVGDKVRIFIVKED